MANKPYFIGIGAQKCASTWVYRVLQDHPAVTVSEPKELDFFSHYYANGFHWYEGFFDRAEATSVCGEVSPSYWCDALSPRRIAEYDPTIRLILTLRDPVDRAYSNHLHEIRLGRLQGPDLSFEAGLANNPMYVEQSCYASHLRRWLEYFASDRILVLLMEDIHDDPLQEATRLYRFLDVDLDHRSEFLYRQANPSVVERIGGLDTALGFLGRLGRRFGMAGVVEFARRAPSVRRGRQANRRHLKQTVPAMCSATEQRLLDQFADQTLELAQLLGRDSFPWRTWRHASETRDKT